MDSFDLVKAVVLWRSVAIMIPTGLMIVRTGPVRFDCLDRALTGFVVACAVATVTSMSPLTSFWGQSQRYTGLLTFVACSFLAFFVSKIFDSVRAFWVVCALVAASSVVGLYGLLQEAERDPFTWSVSSFGKFVFGTMGNPNTASGLVSLALPLCVWLMLSPALAISRRIIGGATFGLSASMLASFDSFQGSAAALMAALLSIAYVMTVRTWRMLILGVIVAMASIVIPNLSPLASGRLVLGCVAAFVALTLVGDRISEKSFRLPTKRTGYAAMTAVALVLIAFGQSVWSTIREGLAGGLVERGDFYRAAWGVFRDNPIFGSGIETFGFVFTEYRPAGHAIRLEGSRTSSVHSVHLGMFSNGGLLVGLAFLAIFVVTLIAMIRNIRASSGQNRLLVLAIGAAWLASHVQSLVSVEHVGLLSTQFVLTGAVWASGREPATKDRRVRRVSSATLGLVSAGTVLAIVLSTGVLARPLQANISAREAFGQTNVDAVLSKMRSAVSKAGWEPVYRLQEIEVLLALGRTEEAAVRALEALRVSRNNPAYGVELSRIIASTGRYEVAAAEVEKTVKTDPFAKGLRSQAAGFYTELGNVLVENGDPTGARPYFERALFHVPDYADAIQAMQALPSL